MYPVPLVWGYESMYRWGMANLELKDIEAREQQIAAQIAELQKELDELATAKRVFQRLTLPMEAAKIVRERFIDVPPPVEGGRPRPKGTPTNVEMAEMVLANAEKEGKDGLIASEMVDAIAARYWPGLVSEQIMPSLYVAAREGTRIKKGASGKFRRVKTTANSES